MFNKSSSEFPVKQHYIYLNNCGVSPLFTGAQKAMETFTALRVRKGAAIFSDYKDIIERVHRATAKLMKTNPGNISFLKNTAEGLSMLAAGYPFTRGDEIVSYIHEYPSNHYPWLLQEKRGVKLKLMGDYNPSGNYPVPGPTGWSISELEKIVTRKTRIIALSHVQFASGFSADLKEIGEFCKRKKIDLIIDAAQSLGSLPLFPEDHNIAAIAASGWKWLMGPVGTGLLYTSPEFRNKIKIIMAGAAIVTQGSDYLNHTWKPHKDGRRFEYSTPGLANAVGLYSSLSDIFLKYDIEEIKKEIIHLQDTFIKELNQDSFKVLLFDENHRSGILSLICKNNPEKYREELYKKGVFCTVRGNYLRIAPHFYNDETEMEKTADILNSL